MSAGNVSSKTLLYAALVMLSGCWRNDDLSQADNRILFDKEGCAFIVQPNVGDTSFVKRMRDADKEGCQLP